MNTRRHFFKHLAGEIARGVQEIATEASAPPPPTPLRAVPAPATAAPPRCASIGELLILAGELDLGGHREQIRALAHRGLRLAPGDPHAAPVAGGSRVGGSPDLPEDTVWPHWQEQPMTFRLQLDLAEVAAALGDGDDRVPARGTLWCFSASEPQPGDPDACAVLLGEAPTDAEPGYGHPVLLSPELLLPGVWSPAVEALALAPHEQRAWKQLRVQLAELQGVTSGPSSPPQIDPSTGGWRLLVQATIGEQVDWSWGEPIARLDVWVDGHALAAGFLAGVRVHAR